MVGEWKGGAFHRNAGHVKQVTVKGQHPGFPLAYQEYSPNFPHKKVRSNCRHPKTCCDEQDYTTQIPFAPNRALQSFAAAACFHPRIPASSFAPPWPCALPQYTLGFAGRPSSSAFYVSTMDNVRNHGPGSQVRPPLCHSQRPFCSRFTHIGIPRSVRDR